METSTSSLRLVEILSEEFAQLHGEPTPVENEQIELKSAEPGANSYGSVIGGEAEGHGEPKGLTDALPEAKKPTAFKYFRQQKVKEWSDEPEVEKRSRLENFKGVASTDENKMKTVLEYKIEDVYFVYCEQWVTDAPLRPFTRGLLEEYKSAYPFPKVKKPVRDKSSGGLFNMGDLSSGDLATATTIGNINIGPPAAEPPVVTPGQRKKATELNRMILEDIYPEYLERQDNTRLNKLYKTMFDSGQAALSLSGGGIRSGTFALGIVQGLAQLGINPKLFTYLSTVSGGGYLGGWLSAWIHQDGADKVFEQLKPKSAYPLEPAPIRHLRTYSNYLSPLVGLFSADTWTLVAIYLRNLIINWLIIIPFLAGLSVIPWVLVATLNSQPGFWTVASGFILGAMLMIASDLFTKRHPPIIQDEQNYNQNLSWEDRNQQFFMIYCLLPGALAIFTWSLSWYWFLYGTFPDAPAFVQAFHLRLRTEWNFDLSWFMILVFALTTLGFVVVEWLIFVILEKAGIIPPRFVTKKGQNSRYKEMLCLIVAGVLSGFLLITVAHKLPLYNFQDEIPILYTCFAFPVFLLIILFNGFIYEGLKSTFVEDAEREWTARYSAWFLIVSLGWAAVAGIILYGPVLTDKLFKYVLTAGAITSYLTAYLGQQLKAVGKPEQSAGKKQGALAYVSLPLMAFAATVILFIMLSFMDIALMGKVVDWISDSGSDLSVAEAARIPAYYALLVLIGMAALCLGFSFAVDMNRFSLHALYRSRLIRAYLGASRPEGVRRPDPFTGFDETDNIYMGDLATKEEGKQTLTKPFHVVSIALNLVSGQNLAWQERKAASFTVSPLHAGSHILGYRRTFQGEKVQDSAFSEKKGKFYGGDRGISLGTAMTISGAAASPNSGYHTSPLVAFFMTLFNLRLGWWLGNPGPKGEDTFFRSSPKWGLQPVLSEMFGQTDEVNPYVFLSDGGHFENLGLYEMAMRRNRFILMSDASCDETCNLEDLGNAIRKIRIDQGITIDFPFGFDIYSRNMANKDGKYWALGRIRYPENNIGSTELSNEFNARDGVLLYVKPGIYGREPKDIFNYASANKAFPHESTADQFFSESQFESYRALGVFVMNQVNTDLKQTVGISVTDLLSTASENWKKDIIDPINKKYKTVTPKPVKDQRFFFVHAGRRR